MTTRTASVLHQLCYGPNQPVRQRNASLIPSSGTDGKLQHQRAGLAGSVISSVLDTFKIKVHANRLSSPSDGAFSGVSFKIIFLKTFMA